METQAKYTVPINLAEVRGRWQAAQALSQDGFQTAALYALRLDDIGDLLDEVERLQAIVDAVDTTLAPLAGDDAQREAWKNYADRGVGIVLEGLQNA